MGAAWPTGITALALALALSVGACDRRASAEHDEAPVDPDCAALIEAAERARACDPALDALARDLAERPDPARCRHVVRRLLDPPAADNSPVRSQFDRVPAPAKDDQPLSAEERDRLAQLPLPGTLRVIPGPAGPTDVSPTTATLGNLPLRRDPDGSLQVHAREGRFSLRLDHAGERATYCVTLRTCETLTLTAQGARLIGERPGVVTGPCGLVRS